MLSLDELTALTGNYPIADQIENLGVEKQDGYLVFEQSYLKSLDKLYQPQYLEEIKAVLMVHTVREMLPLLDEEEQALYRRGRNAHVHGIPKNATHEQYSKATGLECLFGGLYLLGRRERINELFLLTMEEPHAL